MDTHWQRPGTRSILAALDACESSDPYTMGKDWDERSDRAHVVERVFTADYELIVVSDLHVSAGKMKDGTYAGTENFLSDESFARFLAGKHEDIRKRGKEGVLIINGDFLDLLRIVRVPEPGAELVEWKALLDCLGVCDEETHAPFTTTQLGDSISADERVYGLKTNDYKSVWKFAAAVAGHRPLFQALSDWLRQGHSIVVIKGNHDLEWIWPAMRSYFRLVMADLMDGATLRRKYRAILGKVQFIDDAMLVNSHLYIEHGHRFENWTRVLGPPTRKNLAWREINLPAGSFLNRYVLNRVETVYPFLDNIRPQADFLPLLFKEHLAYGLEILFKSLFGALKIIGKRYYRFMLRRVIPYLGLLAVMLVLAILNFMDVYAFFSDWTWWKGLLLGYFGSKIIAWTQLVAPDSFANNANDRSRAHPEYTCIVMGHTHIPEQKTMEHKQRKCRYYNTGTWIPIVETTTMALRQDRTYTFLHFASSAGSSGATLFETPGLSRWNDEACRSDMLPMFSVMETEE